VIPNIKPKEGKGKQAESEVGHSVEDLKYNVKQKLD
jgi:uncharacterized protein YjbJ (UPF0337 family)